MIQPQKKGRATYTGNLLFCFGCATPLTACPHISNQTEPKTRRHHDTQAVLTHLEPVFRVVRQRCADLKAAQTRWKVPTLQHRTWTIPVILAISRAARYLLILSRLPAVCGVAGRYCPGRKARPLSFLLPDKDGNRKLMPEDYRSGRTSLTSVQRVRQQ